MDMQKSVDMEVVGRHALLFDDDAMAAFVNSNDALVEWNSIPIDRYDVRHLLSSPPPPRRRRNPQQHTDFSDPFESELDSERYLDLSDDRQEADDDSKPIDAGGYNAVAFSYGNNEETNNQNNSEPGFGPGFCPPFPVPESLITPPTEKLHQIIARTAMFVSKNGGQSEIVLRVKQGDNPTFGFLMPDHHLHSYFRFLLDHPEVLQDVEGKPKNEKISYAEPVGGGGALSLLGSLYGSAEDEDGAAEHTLTSKESASEEAVDASASVSHVSEKTASPQSTSVRIEEVSNRLLKSKEKIPILRRNSFTGGLKSGSSSGTRKESESFSLLSATADKLQASSTSKVEPLLLEPPSEIKKLVNKIVEFIMKNGKQFEAVLIEQDSEHGRFPFLLPSNQYNPYYRKVLQEAQKSKVSGKSSFDEKDRLGWLGTEKKSNFSSESAGFDIPYDKKETFKMVIGKSKNDGQDPPSKATQRQFAVGVDATAAAAILQAATRGIRNPNLGFLSRSSLNGGSVDHNSEVGHTSSLGSILLSQAQTVIQKSDHNGERGSVSVAKEIARNAALEAASEAHSCEAQLTKEQKLKAERLRRAKMFVAMIKSGSAPHKSEPTRGLSVEPQGANVGSADDKIASKEREGSLPPLEIDASEKLESSTKKHLTDEYNERKARRKYRSRSSKNEDADEDVDDDDEELVHKHSSKKRRSRRSLLEDDNKEEKDVDQRDNKHSRKKHRLGEYDDERDHKYSKKHRHRSHRYLHEEDKQDEEEHEQRPSRKKHRSHYSSHHSRDDPKHRKRHSSAKDRENRHRDRHDTSSDEEHLPYKRSDKHRKISQSEKEELEEGEICSKVSDQSRGSVGGTANREPSMDISSSYQDGRGASQPSQLTEVSDDLRAKIRAMLMGTL